MRPTWISQVGPKSSCSVFYKRHKEERHTNKKRRSQMKTEVENRLTQAKPRNA